MAPAIGVVEDVNEGRVAPWIFAKLEHIPFVTKSHGADILVRDVLALEESQGVDGSVEHSPELLFGEEVLLDFTRLDLLMEGEWDVFEDQLDELVVGAEFLLLDEFAANHANDVGMLDGLPVLPHLQRLGVCNDDFLLDTELPVLSDELGLAVAGVLNRSLAFALGLSHFTINNRYKIKTQSSIAKVWDPPQATLFTFSITSSGLNLLLFGDSIWTPLPSCPYFSPQLVPPCLSQACRGLPVSSTTQRGRFRTRSTSQKPRNRFDAGAGCLASAGSPATHRCRSPRQTPSRPRSLLRRTVPRTRSLRSSVGLAPPRASRRQSGSANPAGRSSCSPRKRASIR